MTDTAAPPTPEIADDEDWLDWAMEDAPAPLPALRPGFVGATDVRVIPDENEWSRMCQLAVTFSESGLVPSALRRKPYDCLLVVMTARELGLALSTAFREAHPIDGRITLSPKLRLALVHQRDIGRVWRDKASSDQWARWFAIRTDSPDWTHESSFTMEEAKRAGLTGKDNWKNYPGRMLSWRALGFLLDDVFPEIGAGLYQPDELGAVTDEDGNPIDVGSVEVPRGMPAPAGRRKPAKDEAPPIAPEAFRLDLEARIKAIEPETLRAELVAAWKENDRLTKLAILPERSMVAAQGLVTSFERRARKMADLAERAAALHRDEGDAHGLPPDGPVVQQEAPAEPETDNGSPESENAAETSRLAMAIVASVQAMAAEEVAPALQRLNLDTVGNMATKRRRLAERLIANAEAVVAEEVPPPDVTG